MAAYKAAAFVGAAIESILAQTFSDFEFLIIDDGSTDQTAEIIAAYHDQRIILIRNQSNLGLIASLNRGLRQARGEFIARMDADDESLPERFARQVAFLDSHPGIGLCGTSYVTMGNRAERWPVEYEPARLKCQLLFDTGFSHPSVMFRRDLLLRYNLYYDPAYKHAEDYDLWARFAEVTEVANLRTVLVKYRLHPESVSHINRQVQRELSDRIRRRMFQKLGLRVSDHEMTIHTTLMRGAPHTLVLDLDEAEAWLARLLEANRQSGYCDQTALSALLYELWFRLCRVQRHRLRSAGLRFVRSTIARQMPVPNRVADTGRLMLLQSGWLKEPA
jgi:glycosyltransferase involved in cell wall biosynthesis